MKKKAACCAKINGEKWFTSLKLFKIFALISFRWRRWKVKYLLAKHHFILSERSKQTCFFFFRTTFVKVSYTYREGGVCDGSEKAGCECSEERGVAIFPAYIYKPVDDLNARICNNGFPVQKLVEFIRFVVVLFFHRCNVGCFSFGLF